MDREQTVQTVERPQKELPVHGNVILTLYYKSLWKEAIQKVMVGQYGKNKIIFL